MMLWAYERLHGPALRQICNAVVWIAELVHVKKSLKLVEINLTTLLWTHAQRCVHVIFCRCFFYLFFMRALVGETAERIFTKLSHVVDIRCYL